MAALKNNKIKRILTVAVGLLKKLHRIFFIIEFGAKKSKPTAQEKASYHPHPQPTFYQQQPSWHASTPQHRPQPQDVPYGYNENKIVLQVRDPWWLHSYWEVTEDTKNKLRGSLGDRYNQAAWVLRVYDVSFIIFDGSNAHRYFDIDIGYDTNNWYINVSSGHSFCADLGLRLKDGTFITVARSNTVTTPIDGPSWILDEEWMIIDEDFMKLYGVGLGGSSPGAKRRMRKISEYISSWGFLARMNKEK